MGNLKSCEVRHRGGAERGVNDRRSREEVEGSGVRDDKKRKGTMRWEGRKERGRKETGVGYDKEGLKKERRGIYWETAEMKRQRPEGEEKSRLHIICIKNVLLFNRIDYNEA